MFIFGSTYNILKDFKSKRSFHYEENGKAKKWQLYAAIGAASVVVLGAGGILLFRQPSHDRCKSRSLLILLCLEGSGLPSGFIVRSVTAKK